MSQTLNPNAPEDIDSKPVATPEKTVRAGKAGSKTSDKSRAVKRGDIAPKLDGAALARHVPQEATTAAQGRQLAAVLDLLGNKDLKALGKLDPLIVGRAHVVYERGEKSVALL